MALLNLMLCSSVLTNCFWISGGSNRILTWLTANPPGFWPQTHQPGGFEGGDKPGAQLGGINQATTINTLIIGKYT